LAWFDPILFSTCLNDSVHRYSPHKPEIRFGQSMREPPSVKLFSV
jgi:hypothetical protein